MRANGLMINRFDKNTFDISVYLEYQSFLRTLLHSKN
jgi:hypothetical protein